MDGFLSVRFIVVGSNFSQKLVHGNPCGSGKSGFFKNSCTDFAGNLICTFNTFFIFCNIKISFIQGKRFNKIGIIVEYLPDLLRNFFIPLKSGFYNNKMRAFFQRHSSGHCRADSEFSGLITRSSNHAVFSTAYTNGLSAKFRIVVLLYGSIKSVHVYVDYFSNNRHIIPGFRYCLN